MVGALMHRRFVLQRDTDVSGVSGTGVVAEGIEFSDGQAVLRWRGNKPSSVAMYDDGMTSIEDIHGHNGGTRIVWIDEEEDG